MRKQVFFILSILVTLSLTLGVLFAPPVAQAQEISKTAMAGTYSVTLKVLPAESFSGPHAAMVRDGGAQSNLLNGPEQPNHHLVAFVRESGKPVEEATVAISYRGGSPKKDKWMPLPVVRMHMAGKGPETTHYGNNVKLAPGSYEARVTVNGSKPTIFKFSLSD
jgi:hypothetical protein